jgi:hypothetical protein
VNFRSIARFAVLASLCAATTEAQVIQFQVGAQYRGVVKKSFDSIGSAGIQIAKRPDGGFRVQGSGRVTHPKEKAKVYEFSVDMQFRLNGEVVEYVSSTSSCNAGSEGLKTRIERLMPFLYLVSAMPAGKGPKSVRTPHGSYSLKYADVGPKMEVTVEEGKALVGKFFLAKDGANLSLEKFRIPTKDNNVTLNFTAAD